MNHEPTYTIDVDSAAAWLTATLHGLWDMETVQRYGVDLARSARQAAPLTGAAKWLIDLRDLQVQPQPIASYMSGLVAELMSRFDVVVAVVTPRALVTMQSRRIAQQADHLSFASIDEARDWLSGQ